MKNLKNKLNKKGGFTLVEMLIVVAIIAILIAVSIPLIATSLEKTRKATDAANERSAKAEAVIAYLEGATIDGETNPGITADTVYYYDAVSGKLVKDATKIKGTGVDRTYGKCTDATTGHKNKFLAVAVDTKGEVHMQWVDGEVTGTITYTDGKWDANLCRDKVK